MVAKNRKIVLIDGNALVHRAFHALPPLTSPQGKLVNAVYGFTTILFKVLKELKPDYIACAFDYPAPTFRHKAFKEYKAHREKAPLELYHQLEITKKLIKILNIPIFEKPGYEADDIIASLVKILKKDKNLTTIILTGDLDELQLVDEKTQVYTMRRGFSDTIIYTPAKVKEKFGIWPSQLVDYKALRGDPSDNIPGVGGIGEKGAAELIKKYHNLENLYQHLDLLPPKIKKLLLHAKKEAFLSKKLAHLVDNLPLKLDLQKCQPYNYDPQKLIAAFKELGFKSLIQRLEGKKEGPTTTKSAMAKIGRVPSQFFRDLEKNLKKINASQIDQALEPVLEKMERKGILIDVGYLKQLNDEAATRLKILAQKIYELVGHEFNINSPQQLGTVLFKELHLPPIKKIKTGYSTNQNVLQELTGTHPVIEFILSYRELFKLKSTYLETLPRLVDSKGRLHTTYTQDTATGRLSSRNPNLQNIPVREGLGEKIRRAFIAPKGYKLLGADYSQIELRIIASLSGDERMIRSFKRGEDIHAQTASEIFNVDIKEITPEMRRIAKTVNFGIIYGMGPHGLAQTLKISHEEAESYIQEYFAYHPGVLNYIETIKKEARKKGYVETLFGRKRYLPEIKSNYSRFQKSAERMAINMPIQGTAADLIKIAMIKIDRKLPKISQGSSMLLQVHDELIFEVPQKEGKKVALFVKKEMENVYPLKVPLEVEVNLGNNWGELK